MLDLMKPFVSCIMPTYARVTHLEESLQCFLDQRYDGERELIIYNSFDKQVLKGDFPGVKIINASKRPPTLGDCWNEAIAEAKGEIILHWPDDDLYLDNHISNFVGHFDDQTQWVWLSHHWFMIGYRIKGLNQGGHKLVAYRKQAWELVQGYPPRDCGCERDFVHKLLVLPGRHVTIPPRRVSYVRHWGNGVFHISGMGDDFEGRASGHDRIALHANHLAAVGAIPTGEVELHPETLHDYRDMATHFLDHPEAYVPELNNHRTVGIGEVAPYTSDVEKLKPLPSVTLVYINVPGDQGHIELASRFLSSYLKCPPGLPHETMIVANGIGPAEAAGKLHAALPNCKVIQHDDSGWDIGGFIAAAKQCTTDIMLCLGGQAYFKRGGWLLRMVEAWKDNGEGIYGSLASYEVSPHLNTTGFWCSPKLLRDYPYPVVTKEQRYSFEHGPEAIWKVAVKKGFPALLVTWDGMYNWMQWREPRNGFRAGDQSDCLTYFKHTHIFDNMLEPHLRFSMRQNSDTLTDMEFIKARRRKDLKLLSIGAGRDHFKDTHKGEDRREAALRVLHPVLT